MRRPSAKTFRLAATIAASAALAACGLASANTNTSGLLAGPSGRPITIGISLPLFGPQGAGGFAPDGQATEKGYELWASDVNSHGGLLGRPVKLIILNDKGVPSVDGNNYKTLITKDHVDLTLAPFSSLLVSSPGGAGRVTEHYGYVLAAGSAGATSVYQMNDPYLFSTNVPAFEQMEPFAKWLIHQPGHLLFKAAYPMVNDPFADPPVQTAQGILQNAGVKTVYSQTYSPGIGTNIKALEAKAKVVASTHPDVVFLGSVAVATVQGFMAGFAKAGFTPKYFMASSGPDQGTNFLNSVGDAAAVGALVPNGWYGQYPNALSHVMVQDYIAKYGGTAALVNADVAEAYSAAEVEQAAVTATHSLNQNTLKAYLHKPSTIVQTVLGPVGHFKADGQNTDTSESALIFQWQPGQGGAGVPQFVQVLPTGLGTKKIIPWNG